MGTLHDACKEAFAPIQIEEVYSHNFFRSYKNHFIFQRRPVLVYIHNDKNIFTNIFSKTIFYSTILIEYLLDNYIVWACDITDKSNRNM